jgi:hypothetical protein
MRRRNQNEGNGKGTEEENGGEKSKKHQELPTKKLSNPHKIWFRGEETVVAPNRVPPSLVLSNQIILPGGSWKPQELFFFWRSL